MDIPDGLSLLRDRRARATEKLAEGRTSEGLPYELERRSDGERVTTAGAVIVRQRPGTAKGFVFLTLEDETGMCQAIVRPDLFREYRSIIVGSGTLVVEGRLQKLDGALSVKGERFWPLRQVLSQRPCGSPGPPTEAIPSHDFH